MKPQAPPQGRPRDDSIDTAVLGATRALLVERGYSSLSFAAVAKQAGTTRQAIYRRWPNKALLVLDAMFSQAQDTDYPDLGDLRAELRLAAQSLAEEFGNPVARSTVSGLLADLATDQQLHARVREQMLEPDHARVAAIFERAAKRGEVNDAIPIPVLVEMIGGAIVYRICFVGLPADDQFLDNLVELAITAARKEEQ